MIMLLPLSLISPSGSLMEKMGYLSNFLSIIGGWVGEGVTDSRLLPVLSTVDHKVQSDILHKSVFNLRV